MESNRLLSCYKHPKPYRTYNFWVLDLSRELEPFQLAEPYVLSRDFLILTSSEDSDQAFPYPAIPIMLLSNVAPE